MSSINDGHLTEPLRGPFEPARSLLRQVGPNHVVTPTIEGFVAYRPRRTGPSPKRDLTAQTGQDQGAARTCYQHKRLNSLALQVKGTFPFSDTQPGPLPDESPRLNPHSFSGCGIVAEVAPGSVAPWPR
jgi:hypothetical protein